MFALQKLRFRLLCVLMSIVTPLAPCSVVLAQTAAVDEQLQYILPYSAAVISARPRQILTSEAVSPLPYEVAQAACLEELGFDPMVVERVVFSMIPPLAGPPSYAILVETTHRIDLETLSPKLTRHAAWGDYQGQKYLQSQVPQLPSMIWLDDTHLLVAPEHNLSQLISSKTSKPDEFAKQLSECVDDDVALLVNMAGLRPLIQLGLGQAQADVPVEYQPFLEIPSLLKQLRLRLNVSGKGPMELSFAADNEGAAERVEELLGELTSVLRKQASLQAARMLQSQDPIEQAMGRYMNRVTPTFSEQFRPVREGERFTVFRYSGDGSPHSQMATVAISGILVGLLVPAVKAAREAARRTTSLNHMKRILIAMHNYHDTQRRLPAHASYDANGKPLLSWRVHLLPYLESNYGELYEQFHLDEPWDSEHNRQLIPQMPEIYVDPSSPRYSVSDGHTHYLAVKGKGFAFDGSEKGRTFAGFRDGLSNSIMVVQCNDDAAVVWTKPDDFEPTERMPLVGLSGGFHPGTFLAGFGDGHAISISDEIDPGTFWKLLTVAGGEVVRVD